SSLPCRRRPCARTSREESGTGRGARPICGRLRRFLLTTPAEDDSADREAEPEGADGERADRERLAPLGEALPAGERRLLLRGQHLAAPALADGASGSQTEVEIVEELGRLGHAMSV